MQAGAGAPLMSIDHGTLMVHASCFTIRALGVPGSSVLHLHASELRLNVLKVHVLGMSSSGRI